MIERMERQGNSILRLTNSKETLYKKLDIEKEKIGRASCRERVC